ncbi:MAG: tetratricopeptide repeat protein [Nitrososphaerales archaeon]
MLFGLLGKGKNNSPESMYVCKDKRSVSNDLVMLGEDCIASKDFQHAITFFEKALEINPDNDFAWGGKALALDYMKRYEEALECYNKALGANPNNAITWHNRGLSLASLKRLKEAVESFEKAIELNPKYAKAWYNKGRLLSKLGDTDGSQTCLNTARKLEPLLFMKLKGR